MGVIIMCSTIIAMGLFFIVFEKTKAGKRFFGEETEATES